MYSLEIIFLKTDGRKPVCLQLPPSADLEKEFNKAARNPTVAEVNLWHSCDPWKPVRSYKR